MDYNIAHKHEKAETITLPALAEQNAKMQDLRNTSLLRPSLFWDVDLSKLDMVQHAAFIIVRVMERGRREEVRYIWTYYGEEIIRKHLLEARSLNKKTVSYFANKFNISRSQFKSFKDKEQVQTWP
jgi:hypothetical protein